MSNHETPRVRIYSAGLPRRWHASVESVIVADGATWGEVADKATEAFSKPLECPTGAGYADTVKDSERGSYGARYHGRNRWYNDNMDMSHNVEVR